MASNQSVVTIGNFDGVHLGHRAILRRAADVAGRLDLPVRVVTFEPHPAAVLQPASPPARLMSPAAKIEHLRDCGAVVVDVVEPTRRWLDQSPQEFVKWLVERHAPAAVVEGTNFCFGKDRTGQVETLAALGRSHGFEVHVVDRVEVSTQDQLRVPVSSTFLRWLLEQGRVADAGRCLTKPYGLTARVVRGQDRGKALRIPTANLDPEALGDVVVPGDGVYAGLVELDGDKAYPAAISVGVKPTFGDASRAVEAHALDYEGDLYGQIVTVRFCRWLRDQRPFNNAEALVGQIQRDISQTRHWHALGWLGGSLCAASVA